jgi:FtsZ-interacting cell division protein ZipA
MAALRWILLLAGLVFLGALTIWELRRPRQARGTASPPQPQPQPPFQRSEPGLGAIDEDPGPRPAAASSWGSLGSGHGEGRRRIVPPLQIELPPQGRSEDESAPIELDVLPVFEYVSATPPSAASDAPAGSDGLAEQPIESAPAPPQESATVPVVDWPPDGQRHIVALRIVSGEEERMSGRAVRLAISACGFVHGRFGIYHQPGVDGRSLLSVASLSKPGILDPENLDFQRLSGINLFTVLPGPLPPAAALDHLVDTARELSERLHARLQDEHGQTLDAERLESLRESMQRMDAEPAA